MEKVDAKTEVAGRILMIENAQNQKKRTTKQEAEKILLQLSSMIDLVTCDNNLQQAIGSLYSFFECKIGKPKNRMDWVGKACSSDDSRKVLHHVNVNENHAVGTDGKRLHFIDNCENLPVGPYEKGALIECNGDYPNYMNVIPTDLTDEFEVNVNEVMQTRVIKEYTNYGDKKPFIKIVVPQGETWIDENFFKDAVAGNETALIEYKVKYNNETEKEEMEIHNPLIIKNKAFEGTCVLMPLRFRGDK